MLTAALAWLARHGRLVLIGGLVVGIAWPALARAAQPLIVPLIGLLLFLAALRIGPGAARPRLAELPRAVGLTLALQGAAPLTALAAASVLGWERHPIAIGIVLALAAAPITGSPGLAVLSGADPVPALRQLVLGTALLPLTVLPVFWLMPVFAEASATLAAAGRLVAVIAAACGGGFLLRAAFPAFGRPVAVAASDGLTTLAMGVVVIGLMSAVGPALVQGRPVIWATLAIVFALNFGIQLGVWSAVRRAGAKRTAPALAIVAGNRNLALFLTALPPETVEALLLFVGCFQIPMYLTPLVMARFYRSDVGLASG